MDPFFLLSLGRAGSTVAMHALNSIDGIYVFGEHNAALRNLKELHESFKKNAADQRSNAQAILQKKYDNIWTAWATPFTPDELLAKVTRSINELYTKDIPLGTLRAWGIKEIKYDADDIVFFHKAWPDAKFVFLLRDMEAQLVSWTIAFNKSQLSDDFLIEFLFKHQQFAMAASSLTQIMGGKCYTLRYEEMCSNPIDALKNVVCFLGLDDAVIDADKVRGVFKENVDFMPKKDKTDGDAMFLRARVKRIVKQFAESGKIG